MNLTKRDQAALEACVKKRQALDACVLDAERGLEHYRTLRANALAEEQEIIGEICAGHETDPATVEPKCEAGKVTLEPKEVQA